MFNFTKRKDLNMTGFDTKRRSSQTRKLGLSCSVLVGAAAASEADADIIASGAMNQVVNVGGGTFELDLNGDSDNDFRFLTAMTKAKGGGAALTESQIISLDSGAWLSNSDPTPDRLSLNTLIDASGAFSTSGRGDIATTDGAGNWDSAFPSNGFLGLRVSTISKASGAQEFFGWVEVTANSDSEIVLNQWAFENQAGVGILAGETTNSLAAVPEPATSAVIVLAGLGYFATRFLRRSNNSNEQA